MKEKKILSIGYQGEKGAYSADAIDAMFGDEQVKKVAYRTSYDVIDALKKNKFDYGLLPLENSIIGNITHNYDLVLENKLTIEREVIIPIHHSLIAHKDAKLDQIKLVYSHPAAISQCEVFLRKLKDVEIKKE